MSEVNDAGAADDSQKTAGIETETSKVADKKITYKDLKKSLQSVDDDVLSSGQNTPNESKNEESEKDDAEDEKNLFPKKAINAINRRDRKLAKQLAIIRALEERVRQLEGVAKSTPESKEPKMEDFDSYGDYLEAKILHKIKQLQQGEAQNKQSLAYRQAVQQQLTNFLAQKKLEIEAKGMEYMKSVPDFEEVVRENIEILQTMPLNVRLAFLKAKDPALAFYNISKMGRWDELMEASPYDAAYIIAEAQAGKTLMRSKAPIPPKTKVSGTGGHPVKLDSYKDIKKWLNS